MMDQVISAMNAYDYDKYTEADVRRALAHDNRTPEDFQALLSPAALPLLEEIAQAAKKETRKHFGNSVYMFTPIYIANYCENYCIYCGFNCHNKIRRAKLNAEEIDKEMAAIAKTGLQEILLLAYHPLKHVPVRSDDKEIYACALQDAEFHTYLNYKSPGIPLHNQLRIHGDVHTHLNS